jgi:hypothetical protein
MEFGAEEDSPRRHPTPFVLAVPLLPSLERFIGLGRFFWKE